MLNSLGLLAPALLAGTLTVPATPALHGELLPAPRQVSVRAVDVSPLGVIAGNVMQTRTAPDGTVTYVDLPHRWARLPQAGWVRQQLALPAGATAGTVEAITDAGEAAGYVFQGTARAVRWSVTGRSSTLLSDSPSAVTAVGPNGPWALSVSTSDNPIEGEAELVTRAGERTALRGTPELDAGNRRTVDSVGGPGTALVEVFSGFGQGSSNRLVLWRDGATLRFPVVGAYLLGQACAAPVRADGSTVYSGYVAENGAYSFVLARHVGGVPGTDVVLSRATGADQPRAGLDCTPGSAGNSLASDGGFAGHLTEARVQRAAYWDAANRVTVVPLAAGEQFAAGVAAAAGGRMAIVARHEDGTDRLAVWDDGVRTPLATPRGWTVASVVELTDAGLLVANLRNAAGDLRPAVWRLP